MVYVKTSVIKPVPVHAPLYYYNMGRAWGRASLLSGGWNDMVNAFSHL